MPPYRNIQITAKCSITFLPYKEYPFIRITTLWILMNHSRNQASSPAYTFLLERRDSWIGFQPLERIKIDKIVPLCQQITTDSEGSDRFWGISCFIKIKSLNREILKNLTFCPTFWDYDCLRFESNMYVGQYKLCWEKSNHVTFCVA